MSSPIFPTPSNVRSIIIDDICGFSVSSLLSKSILDQIKIQDTSKILVLRSEIHPLFPSNIDAWSTLLKRNVTSYHCLVTEKSEENPIGDNVLHNLLKVIETFCSKHQAENVVIITNLTPLLLTHSPSKVSRLLGKLFEFLKASYRNYLVFI